MTNPGAGLLLAIDPGKHASGWALFRDNALLDAGYCPARRITLVATLVIERPQIYPKRQKGDPNDLICVAWAAGQWHALHPEATAPTQVLRKGVIGLGTWPHAWKRTLPKPVTHARARLVLSEGELRAAGAKQLDKWDAITLGLVHLARVRMF